METVIISVQELNVLREALKLLSDISDRNGVTGNRFVPGKTSKETAVDRKKKYERLLETKSRGTKPDFLKKKNGKKN